MATDKKTVENDAVAKGGYHVTEHLMSTSEVANLLATNVDVNNPSKSQGLSSQEAAKRLEANGANMLTPPKGRPEWLKYLLQYADPLIVLLIIAGSFTFVAYGADSSPRDRSNLILAVILFFIIWMLCTAKYMNERAAGSVAAKLKNLLPSNTLVRRGGEETSIPAADLVVGDIVHLTIGTRVSADLKIIQSSDLKLDFSSLTGESDPVVMSITAGDDRPHESKHIAFMSSQVLNGAGYGIVIRCGDNTFIGMINSLSAAAKGRETTLQRDVARCVMIIAIIATTMAICLFSAGLIRGMSFVKAFVNGIIVVLVANIPQGLPATVASALTLTAEKMKAVNVLVKRTDIIESLGCSTRIASDKTGTLTQNKMTVINCWVNCQFRSAREVIATVHKPVSPPKRSLSRQIDRGNLSQGNVSSSAAHRANDSDMSDIGLSAGFPRSTNLNKQTSKVPRLPGSSPHGQDVLSRMSLGMGAAGITPKQPGALLNQASKRGNLNRSSAMTFALNVATATPGGAAPGSVWDNYTPLSKLITIAAVNNKAQFGSTSAAAGERKVFGDATDCGLLRFCDKVCDVDDVRAAFASVFSIPFNSKNKWALNMTSIPEDPDQCILMLKGAPEYVMKKCSRYLHKDQEKPMDDEFSHEMFDAYESFGTLAERVIGHAFKIVKAGQVPANEEEAATFGFLEGFTFCGLLSLMDPPREDVPAAVQSCREAGVDITMITGDHPLTAEAIARKCNIITQPTRREVAALRQIDENDVSLDDPDVRALVVTGAMLDETKTEEEWDRILLKDELVFARTTPQQKLQIVSNFQRMKEIVAVTGDGVNDSPALKKADIGVAMGNPDSSDVAREAADVILLNDNFASLVAAIKEGRVLYDNLKKTVAYTLTHVDPETVAVILNLGFGMPLGLGALLVLSIDLLSEQGPATSLAYEPAEANVMHRPPRDIATDRLISKPLIIYTYGTMGIAESITCVISYLWVFLYNDINLSKIWLVDPKSSVWSLRTEVNSEMLSLGNGKPDIGPEEQARIVREANSAWYISLIMCQFWNIWVCKTRRVSIFKHHGMYQNRITIYGVTIAICIMCLCAYVPWLQENVFNCATPPAVVAWTPHFGFLAFALTYTETAKYYGRNYPNSWFTRLFVW